jgi:cell division protein FtsN
MSENGAFPDEMREAALFTDALRAAVPVQPDRDLTATIVPRLAATARSSTIEVETRTSRPTPGRRSGRPRSRRSLVAAAIAVLLVPLLLAGLALAGVTVPGPARDAFDSVGIKLPNQPSDHGRAPAGGDNGAQGDSGAQGANDTSNPAQAKPKGNGGNSGAAHDHGRKQHEKTPGKAKKTPPGQTKTPPGQAKTPPGQAKKTSPGQARTPPGQARTPPGQAKKAPGSQAKVPPGHSK